MAQTWPQSLPDWNTPLADQQEDIYLRSNTDSGPGKTRKRYSGETRRLSPTLQIDGAQRVALDNLYNNEVTFERKDPKDDSLQTFRFLAAPQYRLVVGAKNPGDRQYDVTLNLYRMP